MFARAASVFVLGLPVLATAIALPNDPAPTCNSGSLMCCNSTQSASSSLITTILGLLGIVDSVTGLVGLTCSPLTVVGVGSTTCTQQTACCTGNTFNGLITLGCNNINL